MKIALVSVVRNHPESVNPLIKSNNLLNNALAIQEALKRGAAEALMKNHRGELAECAMSNIFLVKDGAVRTPPTTAGLLAGVTRAFVLELAAKTGIRALEETLREDGRRDGGRDVLHQHDARDRAGRPRRRPRGRQRQARAGHAAAARGVRRGAADGLALIRGAGSGAGGAHRRRRRQVGDAVRMPAAPAHRAM